MSEDTHDSEKHGHVVGPNPQDRSEGVAAAMQGWRCECGRINGATAETCVICGRPSPHAGKSMLLFETDRPRGDAG